MTDSTQQETFEHKAEIINLQIDKTSIIPLIRITVPGGWIYTVGANSHFVPEPFTALLESFDNV